MLADVGSARPELQRTDETFVEVWPEQITSADGDRWFPALGPIGAGLALDDLEERAGRR